MAAGNPEEPSLDKKKKLLLRLLEDFDAAHSRVGCAGEGMDYFAFFCLLCLGAGMVKLPEATCTAQCRWRRAWTVNSMLGTVVVLVVCLIELEVQSQCAANFYKPM